MTPQTQRWIRVSTWWGPERLSPIPVKQLETVAPQIKGGLPRWLPAPAQGTEERWLTLPAHRVPDTTTRGRQRTSEAQNGYGLFYWQKKAYFKRKLGMINKIIKAKHHFNQMSRETPLCLLNKLPLILGNNNKPAMPSDDTHMTSRTMQKNCQKKTILTLEDHHK